MRTAGAAAIAVLAATTALVAGTADALEARRIRGAVPIAARMLEAERATARLLFVGDVMVGRNVAPVVASDPETVFAGIAGVLREPDLTGGNLESPLTTRPHLASNPYALEAPPESSEVLAAAGFDLMTIANNHSGDAGRASIEDTWRALGGSGVAWAGAGPDLETAWEPLVLDVAGVRVAFLAVDGTRAGVPAGARAPGVAHWDDERVREAVAGASVQADVVVASIHGGVEYLTTPDATFARQVGVLVDAGVDVVWGHGPHVRQPVVWHGRRVAASSLGNFLFDQPYPGTTDGGLLEVLVGGDGALAFREGDSTHVGRRVVFGGWRPPSRPAVLLHGGWWTLLIDPRSTAPTETLLPSFARRAPSLRSSDPDRSWLACGSGAVTDARGGLEGWSWAGTDLRRSEILPGTGPVACADVDGDGRTEPVVGGRR